jgi:glycosyltransferase involved in cell wall biosynthesis
MARIGIDARFFGPIGKGLGRYTQKLIENLEKLDTENEYFIFLKEENFSDYEPKNSNFKKVLANFRWYTLSEQIKFPRLLKKYNLDLVHFPHFNVPFFYRKKFVVTIHDLILLHFATVRNTTLNPIFYWLKFLAYKIIIKSAIGSSEKIIAVSKFTKKDILENFKKIFEDKIVVTYEACENYCILSPKKEEVVLAKYGIINPYILYVGNAYPHKNLERLVLAFTEVSKKKDDLRLVFVGKEDYFYEELKEFVEERKNKNILFADYVPDYDLDTIFHNAKLYVWPSLYEGFGLPPLEAMAKGTPVVSSDHPCMREILGESAYYFNAEKEKEIAIAIEKVLDDQTIREELVKKGYEQIKKYDWKRMATQTLAVYKKALK